MRLLTCALFVSLLSSCAGAAERPLRFSVTESGVMPMVDISQGEAVGGILYDLQLRLAQKIGRSAELLVLPRLRVQQMLVQGEIDVRCYVNPGWLSESHHQYVWSVPFMTQHDVLVSRTPQPVDPRQLHDQAIGTVLGFSYPPLQALFDSGQLRRDDARTQGLVLSKLAAGRYDYAVSNDLSLHWFNRQHERGEKLHAVQELASDLVSCIVRDEPDVPSMQLLRALVRMKQDGEFDAIVQRYR
ncbi:substrate-binding periplasmic protein [Phytopseudomonas dryadis]|uniref:Amino acid ABC transporter substrate-binding protein n=1 Tax=Phytopseudomonas dryadis TaxID=2487520 RepID=A0A4V6MX71_9GAMM|nr:ABC transporter substrate-binding protein [Pseudomonas dryadis]TBU88152.1 amino acid ABC transporter substrate-binding protein [Pseudomonas dryadis]